MVVHNQFVFFVISISVRSEFRRSSGQVVQMVPAGLPAWLTSFQFPTEPALACKRVWCAVGDSIRLRVYVEMSNVIAVSLLYVGILYVSL
jgi:hypothetical protein